MQDFHKRAGEQWKAALATLALGSRTQITWNDLTSIRSALAPFMGENFGHAHLPTGGGLDYHDVQLSPEAGCIEFKTSKKSVDVAKPRSLTLEYIADRPTESFLLLELDHLNPTSIHDSDSEEYVAKVGREEIVELGRGDYQPRFVWDQGFYGHDETGNEIPLPDNARLMTRWLRGKILFVVKGSIWNETSSTYNGQHNSMTANEIRKTIEGAMARA